MSANFNRFKSKIKQCLLSLDVNYFLNDLRDLFNDESFKNMTDCDRRDKCELFISAFENCENANKFERFRISAKVHNQWIYSFLSVNLGNDEEMSVLDAKWNVLDNMLEVLRRSKDRLCVMNSCLVNTLYSQDVFSKANRDYLLRCLDNNGEETALLELFNVVSLNSENWYGIILSAIVKQDTAFIQFLKDEMSFESSSCPTDLEIRSYAEKVINKHISRYQLENPVPMSSHIDQLESTTSDDTCSDYGGSDDCSIDGDRVIDINCLTDDIYEEEIKHEDLKLKDFQLELAEVALAGNNVIIYAPTGTGKTVVAVHIANKHLEKNPNGKIAFLVPRTPLVTQQYRTFEKFKEPHYQVMEMRAKGDSIIGPLKAHISTNQVFVMTSDILRNALTYDDGNKLSSISQFSLIFFDECHNCMKLHPYTKIMQQYFKEKKANPNVKLPQIVGLTASPRSNKKDDIVGMQKSLFELCANLDCVHFSMVKNNLKELEEDMNQPTQTVMKIAQRVTDEFEGALLEVMTICEAALAKMKREAYFPAATLKLIPNNKFDQEYVGFVGNLEKLNTLTISENDGKQKAYCIYRYLNAYYRGLIVNQMFNEYYARETISKYLKHNGVDFTCSYDEQFYTLYRDRIVERPQSMNPSVEYIKKLITDQLEEKPESRILIFVRQVDYTYYLVDVLKSLPDVDAKAIVGSNTKNLLKGCTISEMNEILVRFTKGDTKVLVATTVVEEGLDVGLCNMVISYGHVTNETALIQRKGRARASDSKYILILPPMLAWLEKKEFLNERRKEMMMNLIGKFGQINMDERNMNLFILDYQERHFFIEKKTVKATNDAEVSWNFRCKKCQEFICTSEELRIVESMHRVCINPLLLSTFTICKREIKSFGSQGHYEIGGIIKCKCQNSELGNFMLYKKIPYFQLSIEACNVESPQPLTCKEHSLKKWKDFAKLYTIKPLSLEELKEYYSKVENLSI